MSDDNDNLKTWPVDIFLQGCDEDGEVVSQEDAMNSGVDVTWHSEKIEDNDIHYIRADEVRKDMHNACERTLESMREIMKEREAKLIEAAYRDCGYDHKDSDAYVVAGIEKLK